MAASGERETRGGDRVAKSPGATLVDAPQTLADLGISKTQSSRWQGLANLPEDEFEAALEVSKRQAIASVELNSIERAADIKKRAESASDDVDGIIINDSVGWPRQVIAPVAGS